MCSACFNFHAAVREGTEPSWAVSLAQGVRTVLWAGETFRWSWSYSVKGPLWGVGPISCKSSEWRPQPLKARVLRLILIFSPACTREMRGWWTSAPQEGGQGLCWPLKDVVVLPSEGQVWQQRAAPWYLEIGSNAMLMVFPPSLFFFFFPSTFNKHFLWNVY